MYLFTKLPLFEILPYANQPACLLCGLKQVGQLKHLHKKCSDCFYFFFPLDIQAEERLAMVEERRTLTEQKMSLEREIKKQEKAAQDLILNKNRNNRQKLTFGFKSKAAI